MRAVAISILLVSLLCGCSHRPIEAKNTPLQKKPDYIVPAKCISELRVFPGSFCKEQSNGWVMCQYVLIHATCVQPVPR